MPSGRVVHRTTPCPSGFGSATSNNAASIISMSHSSCCRNFCIKSRSLQYTIYIQAVKNRLDSTHQCVSILLLSHHKEQGHESCSFGNRCAVSRHHRVVGADVQGFLDLPPGRRVLLHSRFQEQNRRLRRLLLHQEEEARQPLNQRESADRESEPRQLRHGHDQDSRRDGAGELQRPRSQDQWETVARNRDHIHQERQIRRHKNKRPLPQAAVRALSDVTLDKSIELLVSDSKRFEEDVVVILFIRRSLVLRFHKSNESAQDICFVRRSHESI